MYTAPTEVAWAVPVNAKAAPPSTAATTTAPAAFALPLALRRCPPVLLPMECLPSYDRELVRGSTLALCKRTFVRFGAPATNLRFRLRQA
ncbi:hypothetical protein GCM10017750_64910 [Streptomyces racemochromogenes]